MKIDTQKCIYRKINLDDLDLFIRLRFDLFVEMGREIDESAVEVIKESLTQYFKKSIPENKLIGILCEYNGKVISSAFLAINEEPANMVFTNGRVGTILNVLTYPEYRDNGVATNILELIIKEARQQQVSVVELIATKDGKRVYRKFGFKEPENTYMRLKLV